MPCHDRSRNIQHLSKWIGALFPCGHIRQHDFLFVTAVVWERPRLHNSELEAKRDALQEEIAVTVELTQNAVAENKTGMITINATMPWWNAMTD